MTDLARRDAYQIPFRRLALLGIGGVTFLRLIWLAGQPIDLYPDEAQYWIWAQHLDWGYFSKPPMIAWIIAGTTALFGENDLAVKAGAPLIYVLTAIVVYRLASRLYDGRTGAWAAIAFITLPSVSLSAIIISTDVPLLLFWTIATYAFVRAREPDGKAWWIVVGIAGGLGLLAKYAMGFWLGSALLLLLAVPNERRHLGGLLKAAVIALALYSPNFVWNWRHGFASYHHTEANADIHGVGFHAADLALFAGSQLAVFGPIFLGTLLFILIRFRKETADPRTRLLLAFSVPTLAVMLSVAALSRAQPNWTAPAYVTATILVVGYLSERGRDLLVQWSVVLHIAMAVVAFGAGEAARAVGMPLPGQFDPLHRLHGWRILGQSLSDIRLRNGLPPVLFDDRETMAVLTYYMLPHPFDAVIWHAQQTIQNGFEMTQPLPATPGGDYLYISGRTDRKDILAAFTTSEQVAHVTVPLGPGLTREIWVTAVHGFKGYGVPPPG